MISSILFLARLFIAWGAVIFLAIVIWTELPFIGWVDWPIAIACMVTAALVVAGRIDGCKAPPLREFVLDEGETMVLRDLPPFRVEVEPAAPR